MIESYHFYENKEMTLPVNIRSWKPRNANLKIVHNAIVESFVQPLSTFWQDHHVL